jgi:anti-anti-sigma factor
MEKDFFIKQEGSVLNVNLGFELSINNTPILQEKLRENLGPDITKVVFDATELVYISSSGIRAIIYAKQKTGRSPEIEFLNCADQIHEVLDISGLSQYINFVKDERMDPVTDDTNVNPGNDWRQKKAEAKQKMVDHFAAHNDVVLYQMKLGEQDDE